MKYFTTLLLIMSSYSFNASAEEILHFAFEQLPVLGTGYTKSNPDPHKIREICVHGEAEIIEKEPRQLWSITYTQIDDEIFQRVSGRIIDRIVIQKNGKLERGFGLLPPEEFAKRCGKTVVTERRLGGRMVSRRVVDKLGPDVFFEGEEEYPKFLEALKAAEKRLKVISERGIEVVPSIREFEKMDFVNMTDPERIEIYLKLFVNQEKSGVQSFITKEHSLEDYQD